MKNSLTALAIATTAVSLSGCGGGGGGSGFTDGANQSDVGSQAVINASATFGELNDGFDALGSQSVAQNVVPTSGSATYNGKLGFDMVNAFDSGAGDDTNAVDASIVGDMSLVANFSNRNVAGSVTNITYADTAGNIDTTVGNLTIDGQTADSRGIVLQTLQGAQRDLVSATTTGTLSVDQGGASDKDIEIFTIIAGQFGSANGTAATGTPEVVRGFVLGGSTTAVPNAITVPNGRFTGETAGTNILP